MECSGSYSLCTGAEEEIAGGECRAELSEESLSLLPASGKAFSYSLRDILDISEGDYRLHLKLVSEEEMTLFHLGYRFEDFVRELCRCRNELLVKDMLMDEAVRDSGISAEFVCAREMAGERADGKCEPRLYETSLVIMPERGEPIRIPYSSITDLQEQDYLLVIRAGTGETVTFSQLGRDLSRLKKGLSEAIERLSLGIRAFLRELLPEESLPLLGKLAGLMLEGEGTRRSDIEALSPRLWGEMEKRLGLAGMKEEYDFLASLAQREQICIGFKRGLLGELTGEYLWFLIPIGNGDSTERAAGLSGRPASLVGNAIAMEAASLEGSGRATYFFRVVSRKDYQRLRMTEDLAREVNRTISTINRCMIEINFRREPIYLTDEQLNHPEFQRYRFSIARLPSLRSLRTLFIGRVIHSSPEQWKRDVMDLLRWNVSSNDDHDRWQRENESDIP